MKKFLALLCSIAACCCLAFGLTTCGKSNSDNSTDTNQNQTDNGDKSDTSDDNNNDWKRS